MASIITRAGKGAPLTNNEADANFTNLNTDKLEINAALGTPASVTLTNATGLPTAGLVDNAVTDAKLRDSAGLSVIGRGANSTGDPADIVAGTNHQVLRRDGSNLAFGAVDLASNQAVTGTLPVNQGGTGITSFGSGVATWLGTPSSANLAAAVTDETGTGALVFANSPTLVTPALGTPSALVGTNITGTAAGLTAGNVTTNANLTGAVTSVGNATVLGSFTSADLSGALTDETGTGAAVFGTNPVIDGVTVPARTNPLRQAIRVAMTAASSGSNGIQVLDNDNLDMGTNNFTLHWEGALPDWTPASTLNMMLKYDSGAFLGFALQLLTTGVLRLIIGNSASGVNYDSTVSTGLSDGYAAKISVSITRESASSAGSVLFFINGTQLGAAVAITAATPTTCNNSSTFYFSGGAVARTASDTRESLIYNRALSAAEVLSLCVNGPALADIGASQVPKYNADFSAGADGVVATSATVTGNQDGISDGTTSRDNCLLVTLTSGGGGRVRGTGNATFAVGRREKTRITYYIPSGQAITNIQIRANATDVIVTPTPVVGQWVTIDFDYFPISSTATDLRIYGVGAADGDDFYIGAWTMNVLGITGQWNAENAQSNTGQIFDSSGNRNHALLPAAGATIIGRPTSQQRQVRWTNTWAGTQELQYIGGVNQAILPANAYIESIVGTVTGATVEDIIIGDGSDTDRYVTITTGLAAGTTSFTLANRTTDGTNLKLTVDVDTNATMSIAWVIRYSVLEG